MKKSIAVLLAAAGCLSFNATVKASQVEPTVTFEFTPTGSYTTPSYVTLQGFGEFNDGVTGNLPAFLHVAMRRDLAVSPAAQRHSILARVQAIQTRAQAKQYINEVRAKIRVAEVIHDKP